MYEQVKYISGGKFVSQEPWQHPQRTIDSHELIIMLSGQAHLFVGEHSYDLQPGDVLHMPPGVVHGSTGISKEQVSFYWLHFTSTAEPLPPEQMHPETLSRTEILCKQLLHCANSHEYPRECADYYIRILLMELLVQRQTPNKLCTSVEDWVRDNSDRPIKVSDVAAHFNFNQDYLSRVFRRYHPEGLKTYMDETRCQRIKQDLASTDLALQTLAEKYGFKEYKYFLKYFRFHEGITPTEYRRAYYKTHINWK
jgi:AraC-like DNA-binding protein